MNKQLWFVIAVLFLSLASASAQCGMYTYRDVWFDTNGNAVGDNSTHVYSCTQSSAYAESHVRMPSGTQNYNSATNPTFAEAVTQIASLGELGQGDFWGFNEVSSACWEVGDYSDFQEPVPICYLTLAAPALAPRCDNGTTTYHAGFTIGGADARYVTYPALTTSTDNVLMIDLQGGVHKNDLCDSSSLCYQQDYKAYQRSGTWHIIWDVMLQCSGIDHHNTVNQNVTCQ